MDISKISSTAGKYANKAATAVGKSIQGNSKIAKFASSAFDKFEAKGGDNSFFGLATIMGVFVLIPRIKSALKRNPDNKEATKDEIKEILFRDIQTILIMLFGLKSLNTVIANISTKMTGIPMVNKAYKPLIDKNANGVGQKIFSGIKNFGSNILATLNPLGGSVSHSGEKIATKYTNYDSVESIQKFIRNIPNEGGDAQKVFDKMMDGAISVQDEVLNGKKGVMGLLQRAVANKKMPATMEEVNRVQELRNSLVAIKKAGLEKFLSEGTTDKSIQDSLVGYFKNPDNSLAFGAKLVNASLKTLALGIEVAYLGFGLPALNQKRLEKKYLSEKPIGTMQNGDFVPFNDRNIKPQEIKLFHDFIKS